MQVLRLFLRVIRFIFTLPIILYQYLVSPALPGACLYTPTCSRYFRKAVMQHGVVKGFILGTTRIFRCAGGLFIGGKDPVPEEFSFRYIGESYRKFWARKGRDRLNRE